MTDKDKQVRDKWNELVQTNREKWAKDLYELVLKGEYWDVSFDRYAKYRVFCIHFKSQIKELFEGAKKQFPSLELTREDVAHDLFLSVTEDEDFAKDLDEKAESIIDMLPKA